MIGRWLAALLCIGLCSGGLHAQGVGPGPGYYRVTDVAADDVLNVRAEPVAASRRVGALAPGAAPVEVLEVRRPRGVSWGLVATGEGAGWVSMRYLEPIELEGVLGSALPAEAVCSGTEPFWGLSFEGATAVFEDAFAELERRRLPIVSAAPAVGRFYPLLLSFAEQRGYAVADRRICSDGMSDIPHGWSLHLIMAPDDAGEAPRLLSGCCRVRPASAARPRAPESPLND